MIVLDVASAGQSFFRKSVSPYTLHLKYLLDEYPLCVNFYFKFNMYRSIFISSYFI